MSTATIDSSAAPAALAPRSTFTRIGDKARVMANVKEARRVGYTVKANGTFSYTVTDPTNKDALVFKSVNVRPGMWATTYSSAYFVENT